MIFGSLLIKMKKKKFNETVTISYLKKIKQKVFTNFGCYIFIQFRFVYFQKVFELFRGTDKL